MASSNYGILALARLKLLTLKTYFFVVERITCALCIHCMLGPILVLLPVFPLLTALPPLSVSDFSFTIGHWSNPTRHIWSGHTCMLSGLVIYFIIFLVCYTLWHGNLGHFHWCQSVLKTPYGHVWDIKTSLKDRNWNIAGLISCCQVLYVG